MTTNTITPVIGQTCTVGNGKTRWEIIRIEANGTVHLSKAGADGYTNRWAEPQDLRNIQSPDDDFTTLGMVLAARDRLSEASKNLASIAARHGKPEAINRHLADVAEAASWYDVHWTNHNDAPTEVQA